MNRLFLAILIALVITSQASADNPLIRGIFTADPAAMVYNGRVYLYTGHDEAPPKNGRFVMRDWRCFSTDDMINWTDHGSPLSLAAFPWARANAWAGQVIQRDGKFYWYVPMSHRTINGFAIGVGVSDSPTGPFKDAIGKALITNDMTQAPFDAKLGRLMDWDDIDPTIFIDDDGQAYLFWGNTVCHYVKLKSNMIEMDGPIVTIEVPKFTEAPWVHKHGNLYYLSYAYDFPEKIAYMTADKVTGPWIWRGVINETIPNSGTNHQSIIEFKGKSYFIYHNVELSGGDEHRRSICVEELFYNADGTIKPITQSKEGIGAKPIMATTAPAGRRAARPDKPPAHDHRNRRR